MMHSRLSHYIYTNNILRDAKSMHNILKDCMYTENEYLNLLSSYQYFKTFLIYIDAMTIYCGLFHLLNTVFNLSNFHIYTVNILRGSDNIVNNIERVQRALWRH